MNIPAELGREEDGRWFAEIPGLPEARAYGSTRREAAIAATIRVFHMLAERVHSGQLQVEDQPGSIILGGTAESLSALLIEPKRGRASSPQPIANEELESQDGKSLHSAQELPPGPTAAEQTDSFIPGPVAAPRTLADYYRLRDILEELIEKVGADEEHPLAAFMDRVGTLVEQYEATHLAEIIESKQKR